MTERKKKIISTALEMFSENGYKATATNQIAKSAKVSEGLIFRHFKNKEGLLIGVLNECKENIGKIFYPLNDLKHPKVLLKHIISIPFNTSKGNMVYCKLLNKLKWEVGEEIESIFEPIRNRAEEAFQLMKYEDPKSEAETLLLILDGVMNKVILDKFQSKLIVHDNLIKKYNV
ncbi:MAG: TetR/AcrR family transcriptional regulator [Bacteroidota bacterium]|nr:TetR/AcrR family transcriptional regulator [Bacteroidota bacterium]